jgi:hypothetical protein
VIALCTPPKASKATSIKKAYKEYKKQPFLEAYAKHGTIWRAAIEVGISRDAVHDWRRRDQLFAETFESSAQDITDQLEQTAICRALSGDVTLLIFLLKSRRPEVYAERFHERSVADVAEKLTTAFLNSVHRTVPPVCTSCSTPLEISQKLAEDLLQQVRSLIR